MTAFKNTDDTIVLVFLNRRDKDIPVTVDINGKVFTTVIAANTIVTAHGGC
jgi:hypothetical protein